jgi:hypothetical protein
MAARQVQIPASEPQAAPVGAGARAAPGRNPRTHDASGNPFHAAGRTIIKEKLFPERG